MSVPFRYNCTGINGGKLLVSQNSKITHIFYSSKAIQVQLLTVLATDRKLSLGHSKGIR